MSGNSVELSVDADQASAALERMANSIPDAGRRSVKQLTVLAEGAMKAEAPEGSGRTVHMRDTIETNFGRNGLRGTVKPTKRVGRDNIPLVDIVTDHPTWDDDNPPPISPLFDWVQAKWGADDISAAYKLQASLVEDGAETFPNPFVDRSVERWEDQVEAIAGKAVRDELGVD